MILVISCRIFAQENVHYVQNGETLSHIALNNYSKNINVYGPNGALALLRRHNPHLKNPDLINIGDKIYLPPLDGRVVAAEASAPVEVSAPPIPPQLAVQKTENTKSMLFHSGLGFSYFRIDARDRATGASSRFLSSLVPELQVGLAQSLSPRWSIQSDLKYKTVKMDAIETGKKLNYQPGISHFSFKFVRQSDLGEFNIGLGTQSRYFIKASSVTEYKLDPVPVSYYSIGLKKNLTKYKLTDLYFNINFDHLIGGKYQSYKIKEGFAYTLALGAKTNFSNEVSIGQQFYFSNLEQNSEITDQKQIEVGLLFFLSRGF